MEEVRVNIDAVPDMGRWVADRITLQRYAQHIPAAWSKKKEHEVEVTVMPDAAPGIYGTLEGYAVEVSGDAAVAEVMFGVRGPGLVSTWILNDVKPELVDQLVNQASHTVEVLGSEVSRFVDLSIHENPYQELADMVELDQDDAILDASYGLSDRSRIVLLKHTRHPRNEYRLVISGGSGLANAYLRKALSRKDITTVASAQSDLDVALAITRRHHAILAYRIIREMVDIATVDIDDVMAEVLSKNRINTQMFHSDYPGRAGVPYAISDTEQVYNCFYKHPKKEGRFIFYNHAVCMPLSKGALFLNSGAYYQALMMPNRITNASTLTTRESTIPAGRKRYAYASPLSTPYTSLPTADDYLAVGDTNGDGLIRNGIKAFHVHSRERVDFLVNENVKRFILRTVKRPENTDSLRFELASSVYASSDDGYRKPMSRILYDMISQGEEDEDGYPLSLSLDSNTILATQFALGIHQIAQRNYGIATVRKTLHLLPHRDEDKGYHISALDNDGYMIVPHATLVWLYYKAHKEAIQKYYEGHGVLPEPFRKELEALHTMHTVNIPVENYLG